MLTDASPAATRTAGFCDLVLHPAGAMHAPGAGIVFLTLVLETGVEPPAGKVLNGQMQWRFANRVELLRAIDTATNRENAQ